MEGFSTAWTGLAGPLARYLRCRGVTTGDVEDVVQETALRLFVAWPRLDTTTSVEPLARTIAINVWRDHLRASARRPVPMSEVPDAPDPAPGVERIVVARTELARVVATIILLPCPDRSLVRVATACELGVAARVPAPARERMRLMRCRKALRQRGRSDR